MVDIARLWGNLLSRADIAGREATVDEDITQVIRGGAPYLLGPSGKTEPLEAPEGFALKRILGRGAMGAVYLAERREDGQLVAVKMLNAELASRERALDRFRREAELMLRLDHPNIIKAYSVGMSAGSYYLTMEYVPGETLDARIQRDGRIAEGAALPMMRQIADALAYSSRKGVVHRDLKPGNVIIREDGVCKLGDMGLALLEAREDLRVTAVGTSLGTPLYIAPEQASAVRDIDARADIYSFGCMFYHALCGRPPFPGDDGVEVMRAHLHDTPVLPRELVPELSEGIEAVILKCMLKDRERRYQNGSELVQHLALIQAGAEAEAATEAGSDGAGSDGGLEGRAPAPAPGSRRSHETHFPFGGGPPRAE